MINNNLLEFIKNLSLHDKKTLTQKNLKLSEEVGELAKAVLPYENAYATTHRFISREKILEELADVFLVNASMLFSENYSIEDFEKMIQQKALKWAQLQAAEDKIKYPVPFEIHITVELGDLNKFKKDCVNINVKPILLDLHLKNNGIMKDLMTSSIFHGENSGAYNEMVRITNAFEELGYVILRKKIETVPWHPAAPRMDGNHVMPKDCYFESHVGIIVEEQIDNTKLSQLSLQNICNSYGIHLSRNAFKKIENENKSYPSYMLMATLRSYADVYEDFKEKLNNFVLEIENKGFLHEKPIIEFSIYDSKISHDVSWIG